MSSASIVLPTRNRPDKLLQALDRVARQTHLEMELVLVRDGGSPLDERALEQIGRASCRERVSTIV